MFAFFTFTMTALSFSRERDRVPTVQDSLLEIFNIVYGIVIILSYSVYTIKSLYCPSKEVVFKKLKRFLKFRMINEKTIMENYIKSVEELKRIKAETKIIEKTSIKTIELNSQRKTITKTTMVSNPIENKKIIQEKDPADVSISLSEEKNLPYASRTVSPRLKHRKMQQLFKKMPKKLNKSAL